jgi:Protein of unknown function (DUF1579)
MGDLEKLKSSVGNYKGTNRLYYPPENPPDETPSNLNLTAILNGKFIRIDYNWSYQNAPQEGSMLIGFEPDEKLVTIHWIDTWHMSNKVLALQGLAESDGSINVLGSYPAPPDSDWGWRIVITPADKSLNISMFNISPQGDEYPAVEASYNKS